MHHPLCYTALPIPPGDLPISENRGRIGMAPVPSRSGAILILVDS
jgi:hypothetical protein